MSLHKRSALDGVLDLVYHRELRDILMFILRSVGWLSHPFIISSDSRTVFYSRQLSSEISGRDFFCIFSGACNDFLVARVVLVAGFRIRGSCQTSFPGERSTLRRLHLRAFHSVQCYGDWGGRGEATWQGPFYWSARYSYSRNRRDFYTECEVDMASSNTSYCHIIKPP